MSAPQQWEGRMLSGVWKKSVNVELDKMGREGWELVAVLPGEEDRRELYFRRPLRRGEKEGEEAAGNKPTYKFADDIRSAFREGLDGKD